MRMRWNSFSKILGTLCYKNMASLITLCLWAVFSQMCMTCNWNVQEITASVYLKEKEKDGGEAEHRGSFLSVPHKIQHAKFLH